MPSRNARLYVDGVEDVEAAYAALPEAFRLTIAASIEIGAQIVLAEALGRVPVDSGDLKESLAADIRPDGLAATVYADVPYAPFVELGTSERPATPYLWPGFQVGARTVRKQVRTWAE